MVRNGKCERNAINACSNGVVSMEEIIHFIEEDRNKSTHSESWGNIAPYNEVTNCTLYNGKAREFGFCSES